MFAPLPPMLDEPLHLMASAPDRRMNGSDMVDAYGQDSAEYRVEQLEKLGYIDLVGVDPVVYQVSQFGIDYLASEIKRAEDEANRKRDQERKDALEQQSADKRARKDAFRFWVGLLVNVIIAFVSAVIGAVLATRTDLVDWIVGLFHR